MLRHHRYAVVLIAICASCAGPSERIAHNTTEVRRLAHSSGQRFERIAVEADAPAPSLPVIKTEAVAGQGEQARILDAVDLIYMALTGVEDQVPWWVAPLVWVCVALAVLGVVFLVWHTGVGRFIRGWLGLVTPAEQKQAKLAAQLIDIGGEEARDAVWKWREEDRIFDQAFRRYAPARKASAKPKKRTRKP